MRVLEFTLQGQTLEKTPGCDFSGIVRGSEGYLKAVFDFCDGSYANSVKIAAFYAQDKSEYAVILDENDSCMVPKEALTGLVFGVAIGTMKDNTKVLSNKVWVYQR